MPLRSLGNSDDLVNVLMQRLQALPGYVPQVLQEAVPTMEKLLSHASTSSAVVKGPSPYAKRHYDVDAETQARIDENTVVGVDGNSITVDLAGGSVHDRPLVPVGQLDPQWRLALFAKIRGGINRFLKELRNGPFLTPGQRRQISRANFIGPRRPPGRRPLRESKREAERTRAREKY